MVLQARGLPNLAASTLDLLPSAASTLVLPWKIIPSTKAKRTTTAPPSAQRVGDVECIIASVQKPEVPDFFRDIELPNRVLQPAPTVGSPPIKRQISVMSHRSLSAANPLVQKSFRLLLSRPAGSLAPIRAISTPQPSHFTPASSWIGNPRPFVRQYRGFGTGGISRSLLANREAAANRNPTSATAQNAFYQVLLKANMPAIVVERYQSGRFATNEAADEAYQRALSMLGGSVTPALGPGLPAASSNASTGTPSGLTPAQIQAVSQAIAAHTHGGNMASARAPQGAGSGTKDGPIHVVVDESIGGTVFRWIKFLLWFCLFTYLSLVVVTMMIEGLNAFKRPGTRPESSQAKAEKQTTRFADVHGCDEAKEELQELVEFLRNPGKFAALGGKLPKGILLVGPPGTGKTLLARAVAGEAGVPFFYMSGSEFDEIYVGVGAKRVRELFNAAKAKAPAIVFIDELDAIGSRRSARDAAYVKQTLNQLLTELDGFDQNSGVIILGATNFPESLDKALTRPGRFDRHVTVPLPDVRGRLAILKHHATKIKAAADIDLKSIALSTSGLSGAELESIVNQAAVHASKLKAAAVTQRDLDWAKDKVIMGAERKSMVLSPKEKEMTAYHEAGHALVSYYTRDGPADLYKVTILPRGSSLGHTAVLPVMDKYSYSVKDFLSQIEVCLGGKLAEEIVYGNESVTSGVSSDLERATEIAWRMVAKLGMSEKLGPVEYQRRYELLSSETKAMVEAEVKKTLDGAYERARTLLMSKRKELDLVAKALVEYETLDKSEVEKVLRGEKLAGRVRVPLGPMKVPAPPEGLEPPIPGLPPLPGGSDEENTRPPPPPPPGGIVAG
ncbi:hypothetical protein VTK73DRAFT_4156 [Phialemonium thermophilum]|uniref:AAA+ ATPase domain-containing protein n=1 Tax=Phialemonium thermophilum TaxID=223376 RepID=A0ABR3Y0I7_9PEZI